MNKRKLWLVSVVTFLLLVILIFPACAPSKGKVVVVPLSGPIQSDESAGLFPQDVITPFLVREHLERAEKDTEVKAIVLRIESPGGLVGACQEILLEMERTKKPIVVSMGDIAISGGYFISTGADKIVALPGTLTGSIGVIMVLPNMKGLFDKLGIRMDTFKGGKHKDMYAGFRELTEEEKQITQALTDEYYEQFIQAVVKGRGMSEERVRSLATGQLYTGAQARELGLIDELGGLETAIALAASLANIEEPVIEWYKPRPVSLRELFFGVNRGGWSNFFGSRSLDAEAALLLEILSRWYPEPQYR